MSIEESVASLRPGGDQPSLGPVVLPTAAIAISESLIFLGFTSYALAGHLITFTVLLLAPLKLREEFDLLRAFMLVPLFRLVNLGLPVIVELTIYWLPLVYAPLIPAIYLVVRDGTAVTPRLGLRRAAVLTLPVAVPLGVLLASIEYRILRPQALIPEWSILQLAILSAVMILCVGLVEELLFRGILQRTLQRRLGEQPGLLLTSGLFGLMHSGYGLTAEISLAVAIGLLLGLIYDQTDSIALVAITHGILNVFLFGVIPLQGQLVAMPS